MATPGRPLYNTLFRKNYVYLGILFTTAFAFQIGYDNVMNTIWDSINKGRQWKDIRAKYIHHSTDDDDE